MDTFVFAVGTKKAMARLQKEMQDLVNILHSSSSVRPFLLYISVFLIYILSFLRQSEFCGDKPKSGAKFGLPDSLAILSEMGEVTDGVMDNKVKFKGIIAQCYYFKKYPHNS